VCKQFHHGHASIFSLRGYSSGGSIGDPASADILVLQRRYSSLTELEDSNGICIFGNHRWKSSGDFPIELMRRIYFILSLSLSLSLSLVAFYRITERTAEFGGFIALNAINNSAVAV